MKPSLGRIIIAALCGASSFVTPPAQRAAQSAAIVNQTPDAAAKTAATARVTNSNTTLLRLFGGFGPDIVMGQRGYWPHNRPQPGWRAVQSRRRHKERMRRQRRNA